MRVGTPFGRRDQLPSSTSRRDPHQIDRRAEGARARGILEVGGWATNRYDSVTVRGPYWVLKNATLGSQLDRVSTVHRCLVNSAFLFE